MNLLKLSISSFRVIEIKTPEIAFLNITTALEFFHENFRPKAENIQSQLYLEIFEKLPVTKNEKNWTQIVRTFDLLNCVIHLKHFKDNISDLKGTAQLIKDSRNHYTHYDENIKKIWSPNELLKNDKLLRELLKTLIFIELQFLDNLIEKILRSRPATFYQNFDENEYSVFFKE